MFNSFYESLPPIHLGKTKFIALFSFYVVYIITFFIFIGLIVSSYIFSGFSILRDYFLIFAALIICYLIVKTFINVYKILISAWIRKVFKLTYNNLLILKKGLIFQFAILLFVIIYKFVYTNVSFSNTIWIILVVVICLFAFENIGLYLGYNSILKPYRLMIQQNLFKFGSQQRNVSNQKSPTSPFGSMNSFFHKKQNNNHNQPNHKATKDEEEKIARSANVPVIDISDALSDKKLSTINSDEDNNKNKDKKDDDSKDDGSNTSSGISAF